MSTFFLAQKSERMGFIEVSHYLCKSSVAVPIKKRSRSGRESLPYYDEVKEICNLPVSSIADKNSVLFLWTTFPQLPEAFKVMRIFTHKTVAFVWVKQNRSGNGFFFGLGYWTRSNAEICLLGVIGHPKRLSKKVHQLIISPIEQHSNKLDIAGEKIITLVGDFPRVELFARQVTPEWDNRENEVTSSISLERG